MWAAKGQVWDGMSPIAGWLMSEKLDGMRAFWDGGSTRGMASYEVPWADTAKDRGIVISTGLWSSRGKVIHAPDWWIDTLPTGDCLDGELWMGYGKFQTVMSICRTRSSDKGWKSIQLHVFDLLTVSIGLEISASSPMFIDRVEQMRNMARTLPQVALPNHEAQARVALQSKFASVQALGGEGLIVRDPYALWVPRRSGGILKIKTELDSEGTVVGFNWGKGKLSGKMGNLVVQWGSVTFEVSGFSDMERLMSANGKPIYFPYGTVVTFKYRELSDDGVPKEARYFRMRSESFEE